MQEGPPQLPQGAEDIPDITLSPSQLLRVARAFACIFWGIPLGLLLFFNALRFYFWSRIPLPPYVIGIVLVYIGTIYLYMAGRITPNWIKRVKRTLFVLFLHVYFAPFVYWWQRVPDNRFFTTNVLGLVFCSLWILLLINQLVGELARALGDRTFRVEASVCGWGVIVLLMVPFLLSVAYAFVAADRHEASLQGLLLFMYRNMPSWLTVLFLLPFTMTMACSWKAKESCLTRLKARGNVSPPAEKP
jgi:hypothetical protein